MSSIVFSWELSCRGTHSNRAPTNFQFLVRAEAAVAMNDASVIHCDLLAERESSTQTFLRLVAQHLLLQMHSMSITPECYSGILVKNTPSFRKGLGVGYICCFLRFSFSFTPLIPCLLPPRDERETTERTAAQLPANKKCCLLIFAISVAV